jgi:hypothetical protein
MIIIVRVREILNVPILKRNSICALDLIAGIMKNSEELRRKKSSEIQGVRD